MKYFNVDQAIVDIYEQFKEEAESALHRARCSPDELEVEYRMTTWAEASVKRDTAQFYFDTEIGSARTRICNAIKESEIQEGGFIHIPLALEMELHYFHCNEIKPQCEVDSPRSSFPSLFGFTPVWDAPEFKITKTKDGN